MFPCQKNILFSHYIDVDYVLQSFSLFISEHLPHWTLSVISIQLLPFHSNPEHTFTLVLIHIYPIRCKLLVIFTPFHSYQSSAEPVFIRELASNTMSDVSYALLVHVVNATKTIGLCAHFNISRLLSSSSSNGPFVRTPFQKWKLRTGRGPRHMHIVSLRN